MLQTTTTPRPKATARQEKPRARTYRRRIQIIENGPKLFVSEIRSRRLTEGKYHQAVDKTTRRGLCTCPWGQIHCGRNGVYSDAKGLCWHLGRAFSHALKQAQPEPIHIDEFTPEPSTEAEYKAAMNLKVEMGGGDPNGDYQEKTVLELIEGYEEGL